MNHDKNKTHDTPRSAGSRSGTAEPIQEKVAEASGQVTEQARRAGERLRRRATEQAEQQKSQFAGVLEDFGAALDRAADELHERGEVRTSDWAHAMAEQLDSASEYLHQNDTAGMWRDLRSFARRRPGLVVAGMFAAGIAAARFLKASEPEHEHGFSSHDRESDRDSDRGEDAFEREGEAFAREEQDEIDERDEQAERERRARTAPTTGLATGEFNESRPVTPGTEFGPGESFAPTQGFTPGLGSPPPGTGSMGTPDRPGERPSGRGEVRP